MNPEEKNERVPIKSLRTFQGDVEEAINKNKFTATTVVMAEQKRREEEPEKVIAPIAPSKTRNNLFLILGIILSVCGVIAIGSVYYLKSHETTPAKKTDGALLGYTRETSVAADGISQDKLIGTITSEGKSWQAPPNSVLYFNIKDSQGKQADIQTILQVLAPRIPASLVRSIHGPYMFGVYSFDSNEPFILLSTQDYPNSYSGMLKWEEDMVTDLTPLFGLTLPATTTNLFTDEAIRNKDLRVVKDMSGKTVLLYSFLDKGILLITRNENIFNAVYGKYLISKQVK